VQAPPLGLYVHFPWCVAKCPYCDFNSHPVTGEIPEPAYIEQVLGDLRFDLRAAEKRTSEKQKVSTIFIGGGTPSLCSGEGVARLLDGIRGMVALDEDVEITLEANPGTVDAEHFAQYRSAGVNRLSIGAQSFQAEKLERLGRIHNPDEIHQAVSVARSVGFERLNLDLMYGLPGQRVDDALSDLTAALALAPGHVSWYQLTIEPKTVFARQPPILPADPVLAEIEAQGLSTLEDAGYRRYEVSAFAGDAQQCRHNVNYWRFGDYLGVGAGAHGKWSFPDFNSVQRTTKPSQPRLYLSTEAHLMCSTLEITDAQRPVEFMMNALRLRHGVEESVFEQRTGLPLTRIAATVATLRADELMHPSRLALTDRGFRFLDSVVARFA
jgi:putative oxygen-independent coproporphyrinogen III oxidase